MDEPNGKSFLQLGSSIRWGEHYLIIKTLGAVFASAPLCAFFFLVAARRFAFITKLQ
jgi:hypothetical protein